MTQESFGGPFFVPQQPSVLWWETPTVHSATAALPHHRQVIHGKVIRGGVWVLRALVNSCVSPYGCIYKSALAAAVFRAVP